MSLANYKKKKALYENITIFIIILIILGFLLSFRIPFILMIVIIISIVTMLSVTKGFKDLSNAYKFEHVKSTLEAQIPKAKYDPLKGFTQAFVFETKIVEKKTKFHSEDFLSGEINGKTFQSADVHIQQVTSNGKTTTTVTTFQGRFFEISFAKRFEYDVYILPNKLRFLNTFNQLKKIDLESIDFNQTFDVFSLNQHSAFFLLKPRLMEKMIQFARLGKSVAFAFKDQFVYVALDTRVDTFDLKMFRPLNDDHLIEVKREVEMMHELIDLIDT